MSCNGCRVLRKGCSETCILRSCLQWLDAPESQGNATLFLAKFFGRSDLLSFISAVPELQRPALFQSLLFEACGRTVNPVDGAVGLLSTGNWHVCQAAVETVLAGGALRPISGVSKPCRDGSSESFYVVKNRLTQSKPLIIASEGRAINQETSSDLGLSLSTPKFSGTGKRDRGRYYNQRANATSFYSDESEMTTFDSGVADERLKKRGNEERKLLNLFV
ncbi:hypothetical protein ACOSP7_010540 [Xanthoceras sorbifolium]|uniref:LOB domain-containing protein n=1 Tax=Xanthoceras sorbifolium TaxID=99658 RepID=A0ABQ8HT11_9ROSI|nr:hypothetical protein JRO89_XS07G0085300 [Xanthoceras sorbifolium]